MPIHVAGSGDKLANELASRKIKATRSASISVDILRAGLNGLDPSAV